MMKRKKLLAHLYSSFMAPLSQKPDGYISNIVTSQNPQYKVKHLNNGTEVLFETPEYPNYISFNIFIKGGKMLENAHTKGSLEFIRQSMMIQLMVNPTLAVNTEIINGWNTLQIHSKIESHQVASHIQALRGLLDHNMELHTIIDPQQQELQENDLQEILKRQVLWSEKESQQSARMNLGLESVVKQTFENMISSNNVLISVGGVYNEEEFMKILNENFSDLAKKEQIQREKHEYYPSTYSVDRHESQVAFYQDNDFHSVQLGYGYPLYNQSKRVFILMQLLRNYIGRQSYFISEGPGRGQFMFSYKPFSNGYYITDIDNFFLFSKGSGIWGMVLKGMKNGEESLQGAMDKMIEDLKKSLDSMIFKRAQNICYRNLLLQMECQQTRLNEVTSYYLQFGDLDYAQQLDLIKTFTKEDLQQLFREILKNSPCVAKVGFD